MTSCNQIASEIAALRADIAAMQGQFIPKSDRGGIINESIGGAKNLIVPIIGTTVAAAIAPFPGAIAQAAALANQAAAAAAAAAALAKQAAAAAAAALAKLAAIAASIAAILAALATLRILGARIDAVERGLSALGADVSRILGLLLPIKNAANQALSRSMIPGATGARGLTGATGARGLAGATGATGARGLQGIKGEDGSLDNATKGLLGRIASQTAFIPALVARPAALTSAQTVAAAATGVCQTTRPGGCMNNLANNTNNKLQQGFNNVSNLLNGLGIGDLLRTVNEVNTKMGAQVVGGLSANLKRITNFMKGERITNFITMAATLHNAAMLSNALATTLVSTVTNVFAIIGLRDADGQPYDASELLQTSLANFTRSVIGNQNYDQLTLTWKKANRVYQAGANVVSRVRSIVDSVRSISEITNINVADIGNALRRDGAVKEDSYSPMSRTVGSSRFQKAVDRLTNLTEAASDVESVSSSVRSVQEDIRELQTEQTEFKKAIKKGIDTEKTAEAKTDRETNFGTITEKDLERAE
ncbi:collagen-like triple helix repeat-containing protein [Nodularia sphaerocarpa]|uniref:collagen-like triple helix repeat-containing protein n=1 Tax=Nodularia sphaerocarpa TaxID=137816 RepID=UPI00232BDB57|nr:collagen-like protein [Nodularia sphaerocarpa]MDB9374305.1 collagen-like protein [Nodularia sphaerocarpa CS-585]